MNQDRRTFLGMAAAASLVPLDLYAQAPPAASGPRGELARHALTGALDGFEAVLIELKMPAAGPARGTAPGHRHPGPVLGYVLEGQMRFAINHEPVQILPVGATFFEETGALHTGSGSASTDAGARALVFMVVPKGASLVAPT